MQSKVESGTWIDTQVVTRPVLKDAIACTCPTGAERPAGSNPVRSDVFSLTLSIGNGRFLHAPDVSMSSFLRHLSIVT